MYVPLVCSVRRADNLTTYLCWLSWNLGASTSWNPQGFSRPVMGLLYLTISVYIFSFRFLLLRIISRAVACEACQWLEFPLNGFRAQSRVSLIVAFLRVISVQACFSIPAEAFKLLWLGRHCLVCGNMVYIPQEGEDDSWVGEVIILRVATPYTPSDDWMY
jgi:hypothetical protein